MSREIEAKFRVDAHEAVRERLRRLDATRLGRLLETNRIFDRPDGSLRDHGCGLRIRATLDDETRECRAILTFKGPVVAGAFKSREELEIQISDAETAARMLEALGYVLILIYEKRRESWRLGDCRVELDEPPHIGLFVEIEGPTEAAIQKTQAHLGLRGTAHIRASYVRMLAEYCDKHRMTTRVLNLPQE
jgi:adenylate cyclase class 2